MSDAAVISVLIRFHLLQFFLQFQHLNLGYVCLCLFYAFALKYLVKAKSSGAQLP